MNLNLYLDRINYNGQLKPDLETLCNLHRLHLLTIPYENFDIHLGRKIELDELAFFNKIVLDKRGGWCFEMNGLFAWVLREVGFKVQLLAGSVRAQVEDKIQGNHLILLVELEKPYLVDVGFGDGFLEPLPLEEGQYLQNNLTFRLSNEGGYWVVNNYDNQRFDFTLTPYTLQQFADKCYELQTSPESGFVKTTVCQRITPDNIFILRGATFKKINYQKTEEQIITTEAEYGEILARYFLLELGDISALWPRIWAGHQQWLKQQATIG